MFVAFRFRYVNQLNTDSNIYATTVQSTENFLTYTSKGQKFFLLHLGFAIASQTTSPQDNKTTSGFALLVVSLTRCLVVWRSKAKFNFRDSVNP